MTLHDSLSYKPVELEFGTSGLRGLVTDMTDLECYINTSGFISFLKQSDSIKKGAVISIGGDLRTSTPRILQAVAAAISNSGYKLEYCGLIPTPALAYWAKQKDQACIMVTGSHIPADRNGIKFYKPSGEVLKSDEFAIKACVKQIREEVYSLSSEIFNTRGSLMQSTPLPARIQGVDSTYLNRFTSVLSGNKLLGKQIIVYQHSAVGRDLLVTLLEKLGASVVPVDRSDSFVSIDTENVTPDDQSYFKNLAKKHPNAFAIVSTDGDSDRPFVVDETGEFHRGDMVGFLVARELKTDFVAIPVSSSDAVDSSLNECSIHWKHTKIGSPYVIESMQQSLSEGSRKPVGWEVNGGFLTAVDIPYENGILDALPTRDAFLPIVLTLAAATNQSVKLSELFKTLPQRFTQAGLLDNFPRETSTLIIATLAKKDSRTQEILKQCFTDQLGFGKLTEINTTDGVRITFDTNEIAHIRPSGNAPQLRIYSVANTQARADEIVKLGLADNGILRSLQKLI